MVRLTYAREQLAGSLRVTSDPDLRDPYVSSDDELDTLFARLGEPAYRTGQLRAWLARGVDDPTRMTDLPARLREILASRIATTSAEVVERRRSDAGATLKLLVRFPDAEAVETVVMRYPRRTTVCISTQAGCAMGCPFCATGQAGLRRQLTTGEIVRQVMLANEALRDEADASSASAPRVTNVVYMGMGEPLANLTATLASVGVLRDERGLGLSARAITVSTVGLVPGMRRLAASGHPVTLAVSLHAATDELRDVLVPINTVHPLAQVERAAREHRDRTGRRVSLEWCLIGDVNDGDDQARALAGIARRLRAHVNVIPMNPTPGVSWREPDPGRMRRFVDRVRAAGAEITLRDTRGRDADAACGQLLAAYTLGAGTRLPVADGADQRVDARRGVVETAR